MDWTGRKKVTLDVSWLYACEVSHEREANAGDTTQQLIEMWLAQIIGQKNYPLHITQQIQF